MTVYFISAGETEAIKIGFTSGDPLERMALLQTGCPLRLSLIGSVSGTTQNERSIHAELDAENLMGEWFKPAEPVFAKMREILSPGFKWPEPVTSVVTHDYDYDSDRLDNWMLQHLMMTARVFGIAENISLRTVSWRALGDSKKLNAILDGSDICVGRFAKTMRWFSDNWPENAIWPEGIERPAARAEQAAE